jgi:hypothetical protein
MTIDIRKFRVGDTVTIFGTVRGVDTTNNQVSATVSMADGMSPFMGIFNPKEIATHTPKSWAVGDTARAVPKLGPGKIMYWPKVKIMALNEQGWAWVKNLEEGDDTPFTVHTADLERI